MAALIHDRMTQKTLPCFESALTFRVADWAIPRRTTSISRKDQISLAPVFNTLPPIFSNSENDLASRFMVCMTSKFFARRSTTMLRKPQCGLAACSKICRSSRFRTTFDDHDGRTSKGSSFPLCDMHDLQSLGTMFDEHHEETSVRSSFLFEDKVCGFSRIRMTFDGHDGKTLGVRLASFHSPRCVKGATEHDNV